jgi:(p)ppGpp synthase/HD superfamily hydrolase
MPQESTTPLLGPRFASALGFAALLHAAQRRKGTQIPYVSHLLAVTALALEHGANEDEAIAAVLHDAIEDQGHHHTRQRLGVLFGSVVQGIVVECSDSEEEPKPPWRDRKRRYHQHVRKASPSARLVSMCDKLHNARSLIADLRRIDHAQVWGRFNAGRDDTLWNYRELVSAYREAATVSPDPRLADLLDELARTVDELDRVSAARRT